MKKIMFIVTLLISAFIIYSPIHVKALSMDNGVLIVDRVVDIDDMTDDYNQEQRCTGSDSILGDPQDPNSVAWLLDKILSYATLAGVILVVILSSLDFLKAIVSNNDDTMAKAKKKLALRLVFAVVLFFVPTITNALLDLFGLTSESTCGIGQ